MAQVPVKSFFVTLRRSFIGKPWFHKRTLEALGFKHVNQTVEKPNNASMRGQLAKVAHLVLIETDQMYYNRRVAEHDAARPLPPVLARHGTLERARATTAGEGSP